MKIVEVAPLQRIPRPAPQLLSYLSKEDISPGVLVKAPLRHSQVFCFVFACRDLDKQEVKNANFVLKAISEIVHPFPVFDKWQLELAWWLAEYHYTSPGLFLKMMLPKMALGKKTVELIKQASASRLKNEQELIIVPTLARLNELKEKQASIAHSGLSAKQLKQVWLDAKSNRATKIVGTKIALFLPFRNLRKITLLNESSAHHRSWDQHPHWQAHKVALRLGKLFDFKPELEDDFPSIESFHLAKEKLFRMKADFSANQPKVKIIDQRQEADHKNFSIFSRDLQGAVEHYLKKKEPVVLFNLRRGAATFILCKKCGYTAVCPDCAVSLVKHKVAQGQEIWLCHHCGYKQESSSRCPDCDLENLKEYGVGTQKVEAIAKIVWPRARVVRLDSDSAPDAARQQEIIAQFNRGRIDVLIGSPVLFTQRLKKVKLVAVVSADTILNLPDFRSSERLYKTIYHLKNLTHKDGSYLLIQTFNPEDRTLNLARKNRQTKFIQEELQTRKLLNYPPFCQLIKVSARHKEATKAIGLLKIALAKLREVQRQNKLNRNFEALGPLPAFISRQKGLYVYNLIIKYNPPSGQAHLTDQDLRWRNDFLKFLPSNVIVDVDPESVL